jgi:hypothetical protein
METTRHRRIIGVGMEGRDTSEIDANRLDRYLDGTDAFRRKRRAEGIRAGDHGVRAELTMGARDVSRSMEPS